MERNITHTPRVLENAAPHTTITDAGAVRTMGADAEEDILTPFQPAHREVP